MIQQKQNFDKFNDMEQKDMSLYKIPYNKLFGIILVFHLKQNITKKILAS